MMETVRTWLTAVVLVSLLLSVVQSLVPEGAIRRTASFTGGLILLLTLLRPVLGADLARLEVDFDGCQAEIAHRQAELETAREETMAELIRTETEAYIKDKGSRLGLAVSVRVETRTGEDGIPVPWSAEVTGPRSEELAAYLEAELGIPAERQVWHERNAEN